MTIVIDYQTDDGGIPPLPVTPVSSIITRCGHLLLDADHRRWTVAELIIWINESFGAIAMLRPDAFGRTALAVLDSGTYQSLPNGSVGLADITRNLAANGAAGRAIRKVEHKSLDDANPDWHTMPQSATVRHFTYNPVTPRAFYVWPPAIEGTKVEVIHVVLPPNVTTQNDTLPISREYEGAVINYVCYRANLKDSEYANAQVASLFYQAYTTALGINPTGAAAP